MLTSLQLSHADALAGSEAIANALMGAADVNGDGELDLQGFEALVLSTLSVFDSRRWRF